MHMLRASVEHSWQRVHLKRADLFIMHLIQSTGLMSSVLSLMQNRKESITHQVMQFMEAWLHIVHKDIHKKL